MNLQFEFCPPPLGAPGGGQKNFWRFAQILHPPIFISVYALDDDRQIGVAGIEDFNPVFRF